MGMLVQGPLFLYDYCPDTGEYRVWNIALQRWSVPLLWTGMMDEILSTDFLDWLPDR